MVDAITDEVAAKVVQMYEDGAKLKDITEATGVPRSSIYWLLQKAGADPNRQGTRRAVGDNEAVRASLQWAMRRIEEQAEEIGQLKAENAQLRAELLSLLRK